MLALRWTGSQRRRPRVKVIRCECGFVARSEDADRLVEEIQSHLAAEHPALAGSVSRKDLASWIQTE
jgi:predicted small metal-binding protein